MIEVLNISVLALRKSAKSLFQCFFLLLFFASIFILLGKQLYKGVLTQKCVANHPLNISDVDYAIFVDNSSNWLETKNGYYLCGNGTAARKCPPGYVCLKGAEIDSFYSSNFNFYGSAVVTISQLMTLHFWQELYQRMLLTVGSLHVIYFVLAFHTFFYLNGLILAIITRSYKVVIMELNASEKTATLVVQDNVNKCPRSRSIVKSPSCKSYELFVSHVKTVDKPDSGIVEDVEQFHSASQTTLQVPVQKSHELPSPKGSGDVGNMSVSSRGYLSRLRTKLQWLLLNPSSEGLFLMCIVMSTVVISIHRFGTSSAEESILSCIYCVLTGIGFIEVLLKSFAFGPWRYFSLNWNKLDFVCVIAAAIEIFVKRDYFIMLIFRSFKLVCPFQKTYCSTCNYLISVAGKVLIFFCHPGVVLTVFITICIVSGMQLYGTEYFDSTDRFPDQESPRWFFRDCYSSFLLVFCMLCGDWKQPMVNAIFFTSYASNFLMLLYVLIGNLVVMNLFPALVFHTFYYKMFPEADMVKDQNSKSAVSRIFQKLTGKENAPVKQVPIESELNIVERVKLERYIATSVSQEIINKNMGKDAYPRGLRKPLGLQKNREFEIIEDVPQEYMADCCPTLCYLCCSFCKPDENPVLWQTWTDLRCRLYCLVETKLFRIVIGMIIIVSVIILILERTYSEDYPIIVKVVRILEPTVIVLFIFEMFLKWTAYGMQKYFKSPLGRLEFAIVLIYLADLLTIQFFDGQKDVFKALRSFRLLSVIQLMSSYQEVPPLPLKRNSCSLGSENASRESLLHLKKIECDHFLGRNCRQRPMRNQHVYAHDPVLTDWKRSTVYTPDIRRKVVKNCPRQKKPPKTKDAAPVVEVVECLPSFCYDIPCCCQENGLILNKCQKLRGISSCIVGSGYFLVFMIFLSIASNVFVVIEMMDIIQEPIIFEMAFYYDKVFTALFIFVMLLKLVGLGFKKYFSNPWCWLEFVTTVTSLLYVILAECIAVIPSLKFTRIIFLLYVSRGIGFNKQSQILLKSLGTAIPSYIIALVLCLFLWLVHAVVGVYLFQGMSHCCSSSDEKNGVIQFHVKNHSVDKANCVMINGTYSISTVNFDSVNNAYIALLQVATLQNWLSLVTEIMDYTLTDGNLKYQIYTSLYFPSFVMLSTFLTLNFFAGVTMYYYCHLSKEMKKEYSDETQKLYHGAVRKMKKVTLQKGIPEPQWQWQKFAYRMVNSDNFEMAGFVFIGLHMLLIALDMYDPHPSEMFALAMTELNIFFIVIFSVESILRLIAMRQYFFLKVWNMFDVFVLALCILGALFESKIFISPMLPAMLRVMRFLKAPRYLRRHARGVLPLISTLRTSIPTTISVCILQFIIMCIYAVLGVYLFKGLNQEWDVSGELNFDNFTQSMLLLFQLSTLAGWTNVLELLTKIGCYGKPSVERDNIWTLAIMYIISYLFIMYYIVVKSHLVVVLENYESSMEEFENAPLLEDYKMFAEIWLKFDSSATGILKFNKLSSVLDTMEEPFHFFKPNRFLIVSLNVPIYEDELIFYGDVMDALTRDFMARNGHIMEQPRNIPKLVDRNGRMLKKVSSSLWRQRQNYCARVIQHAWKRHTGRLFRNRGTVFYSEVRLASDSDKVDTYLASNCRFSSHASV